MTEGVQLISSAGEPISLESAKLHLRIDHEDDDDEILLLVSAVRKFFEKSTNQTFATAENWLYTLDNFPLGESTDYEKLWEVVSIRLPHSPTVPTPNTVSVNSITYVDTAGDTQTLATSEYLVDVRSMPCRIAPAYGKIWPVARYEMGAVRVNYTITPVVDEDILAGMLLLLGHWNEHREAAIEGTLTEIPLGVKAIIALNWTGTYMGAA